MSIIEHLEALRRALIIIVAAWGVATIGAFFISGQVVHLLILRAGIGQAVYLAPAGGFLTELKVALYLGLMIVRNRTCLGVRRYLSSGGPLPTAHRTNYFCDENSSGRRSGSLPTTTGFEVKQHHLVIPRYGRRE